MTAIVSRGNALDLHLPDASVDLIVTSPPYFGLRSYQDGGEHYAGQIGDEATPAEYLDALITATAEWMRCLKPGGSIFVNLGDKYAGGGGQWDKDERPDPQKRRAASGSVATGGKSWGHKSKTLIGLPWRYAIRCIDELGLILRAEIVWAKPNGLPESVTDRVRRSHEQVFHFVKQPRYYSAVDEVREPAVRTDRRATAAAYLSGVVPGKTSGHTGLSDSANHPLGSLPGSVWSIPTAPLKVPDHLGVDHFAAYPPELVRRIVLGWSPREVCTACGEGRRPVSERDRQPTQRVHNGHGFMSPDHGGRDSLPHRTLVTIVGSACACPQDRCPCGHSVTTHSYDADGCLECNCDNVDGRYTPAPTTPGVVLDPFGGTGTSALVASAYGRVGISVDLSADYCRLAKWRTSDPGERARVLGVDKPEPVPEGQLGLFEGGAA